MTEKQYGFRKASQIEVPDEFFHPIKTHLKCVDESWSEIGGIIPSQVTFITGTPGAGKTTLALAIAAILASLPADESIEPAFISLEMSEFQLKHQAMKIPGFGNVNVTGDFHQEETLKMIRELKPKLIILDSIQKAARKMKDDDGKIMAFNTAQYKIVEMFTKYAKETWTPVFLIGHCDKAGNYKGPSDLLHDVDSHLIVSYDKEMDIRTFGFGKNRFGGIVDDSIFGITADSVWLGTPYIETHYQGATIQPSVPTVPVHSAPVDGLIQQCLATLEKKWDGSTGKIMVKAIFDYLRANDPEISRTIVDAKKLKLDFRGKSLAHCHPNSGELVFGEKTFTTKLEVGKVGYAKEQQHIVPRITTRAQMLVWIVVHEWIHLYKDRLKHTTEFFQDVADKYDWLQNELS